MKECADYEADTSRIESGRRVMKCEEATQIIQALSRGVVLSRPLADLVAGQYEAHCRRICPCHGYPEVTPDPEAR